MGEVKWYRKTTAPTVRTEGEMYFVRPSGVDSYIQYIVDNTGALIPPAVMAHGHVVSDIVGLQTSLDAKANLVTITAGSGLTGGGSISGNISLAVNFGTASGTVAQGNDSRIINGQTAFDRWISVTGSSDDLNTRAVKTGVDSFAGAANSPSGSYGSLFSFVVGTSNGVAANGSWINQIHIGLNSQDWYFRTGTYSGGVPSWNPYYLVWTTKRITQANVDSWNLAATYTNHATAGYIVGQYTAAQTADIWISGRIKSGKHTFGDNSGTGTGGEGTSDGMAIVSRTVDPATGSNAHAFIDATKFKKNTAGWAYNSFTAYVEFNTNGLANDHYAAFQDGSSVIGAGSLGKYYNYFGFVNLPAGVTVGDRYGFYAADAGGSGVITNNYGLYVPSFTRGTNNWAVYSVNAKAYFGGDVKLGTSAGLTFGGESGTARIALTGSNFTFTNGYINATAQAYSTGGYTALVRNSTSGNFETLSGGFVPRVETLLSDGTKTYDSVGIGLYSAPNGATGFPGGAGLAIEFHCGQGNNFSSYGRDFTFFHARDTSDWYLRSYNSSTGVGNTFVKILTSADSGGYVPTSRTISVTSGLTGGGSLSSNITIGVNFGSIAGTVAQGNDSRIINGQTAFDRWVNSVTGSGVSVNTLVNNGVSSWDNGAIDRPGGKLYGSTFAFTGNSSNGITGSWLARIHAATDGNWYVQTGSAGNKYEVWTTKILAPSDVTNWNTAYGWGNHSSVGYLTSINSSMVISALGYTPYNASNPNGYTSNNGTVTQVGLNVPFGFEVVSTPVTGSGNLQFAFASGYTLLSDGERNTWNAKLSGSGTANYLPYWTGSNSFGNSSIRLNGSEWLFGSGYSYGYEGVTAFREQVNIHKTVYIGRSDYHGSVIIHNESSAPSYGCAAFAIESTTRGLLLPRMSRSQRLGISSPVTGLMVYQTDTVGSSLKGVKVYDGSNWYHQTDSLGSA